MNLKLKTIGIVNNHLCATGIMDQLLYEGVRVKVFVANVGYPIDDGTGMKLRYGDQFQLVNDGETLESLEIDKIQHYLECLMAGSDFIFFDYSKDEDSVAMADYMRSRGASVIGPTAVTRALEMDRAVGKQAAQACAAAVGGAFRSDEHSYFNARSVEEALGFVTQNDGNYVIKGDLTTIIPINRDDCLHLLGSEQAEDILGSPVFLERELECKKAEIAFSFFWNGSSYLNLSIVNREYKGMFNGTQGNLLCGEAGTICEFMAMEYVPAFIRGVMNNLATTVLSKTDFKGFIDINTFYLPETDDYHFLEWTPRSGIPTEQIIAAVAARAPYGYYGFLRAVAGLLPVDTSKMWWTNTMSVAYQWKPSDADYHGTHSPKVHGLSFGAGCSSLTSVVELSTSFHSVFSLMFASYAKDRNGGLCVIASPHQKQRTGVLTVLSDEDVSFGELSSALYKAASSVKCWAHYYRTDIGRDVSSPKEPVYSLLHSLGISEYVPESAESDC